MLAKHRQYVRYPSEEMPKRRKMLSAGKVFGKAGLYRRALTKEQLNNKQKTKEQ